MYTHHLKVRVSAIFLVPHTYDFANITIPSIQLPPSIPVTLLLTYDIVRREPALHTQSEYCLSAHTVADWGMFCRETMLC